MISKKNINKIRQKRIRRVRAKIFGTSDRPRLAIKRSNRHIYAQLIDDVNSKTLVSASSLEYDKKDKLTKIALSEFVGKILAKKSKEKGIDKVVFDRRSYKYHGRVKALAEAARKAGLEF